jgi:signal transduction histidine kinase
MFSSGTGLFLTSYRHDMDRVVGYVMTPLLTVAGPLMLTLLAAAVWIRKLLTNVMTGVQSCTNRVTQIREFIRPSKMQIQDVELQSVVIDAQTLIRQEVMNRGIEWNLYMPMDPVYVKADPMQLTHTMVQGIVEQFKGKLLIQNLMNGSGAKVSLALPI